MVKKTLVFMLAALLIFVLIACQKETTSAEPSGSEETKTEATQETKDEETEPEEMDGPLTPYEETIILTYGKSIDLTIEEVENETFENNQFTRFYKEFLNIDCQSYWQVATGADTEQRISLAIASDDLPDILTVNRTQLAQVVRADQAANLTDYYDQYLSDTIKYLFDSTNGLAMESVTFNGEMKGVPSITVPDDAYHLLWIRKDWLDKLEMDVPKTVDDLIAVAEAFIAQDPDGNGIDDTLGIMGPQNGGKMYGDFLNPNGNMMGFDPIFNALDSYPGFWIYEDAGNVAYGSIMPETKAALAKLADMYQNGIIDPEMAVRDDSTEPIVAGKSGIFVGLWWNGYWPLPSSWENNPDANWQAYPLYSDDGNTYFHVGTPHNTFVVVNKNYEHPEALFKMISLGKEPMSNSYIDESLSTGESFWVVPIPIEPYDAIEFEIERIHGVFDGTFSADDLTEDEKLLYAQGEQDIRGILDFKLEPYDNLDYEYWNPAGESEFATSFGRLYSVLVGSGPIYASETNKVDVYSLIYGQTDSMPSKWSNLSKLEDEIFLKIVMGAEDIDAFDTFVEQWKEQGGDQITAEVAEYAASKK